MTSIKCKPFKRLNLSHDMHLIINHGLVFGRLNPNLDHGAYTVCPHVHRNFVSHLFSLICQHIKKPLKVLKPITGRFVIRHKLHCIVPQPIDRRNLEMSFGITKLKLEISENTIVNQFHRLVVNVSLA